MRVRAALLCLLVAGATLTAVALASKDASVSVAEPQPGGTLSGTSQSIGSATNVTMSVTGNMGKTTLVNSGLSE